uniref:FAD-binding domain-containing protein n=1 Tax=Prymnesium polylepis TaxID=72548 RepID=A0A6T8ALW0_9EUKA
MRASRTSSSSTFKALMLRATLLLGAVAGGAALRVGPVAPQRVRRSRPTMVVESPPATAAAGTGHAISSERPLRVIIAGAGVGGLTAANALRCTGAPVDVTVIERTAEFKRFGGPIQLASNAMQNLRNMDGPMYDKIEGLATWTGNRTNGIKDGVRDEWYAKFDLMTPAKVRDMPYTCVIERPDLQSILLEGCDGCVPGAEHTCVQVRNSATLERYEQSDAGVKVHLEGGETLEADILVGADGIWSCVRAQLRDEPARGEGSGVTYSGYTVFAGELDYGNGDPECGYKVYIGPNQYFVITDIGRGRYQWYAFLSRPPGSAESIAKPEGSSPYLQGLFTDWSPEIHDILQATQEHEIEQRDLYDRPPSVLKPWGDGRVTLLGDSVHAMMPNLGQGGCQAIEDAIVLAEELVDAAHTSELPEKLKRYNNRRLARSATVQGLSRFASDIIIQGFDTPFGGLSDPRGRTYAGVVTRILQPLLPVFFSIQFNFLYSGWRNERFALEPIRDFFVLAPSILGVALVGDALLGGELLEGVSASVSTSWGEFAQPITQVFEDISSMF